MKTCIHHGKTFHCRHRPVRHQFQYPLYFFEFDLEELERGLPVPSLLFRHNRFALFSLHDRDYLRNSTETIRSKVMALLSERGFSMQIKRTRLFTCPRFLGYAFNPVSFYYCHDENEVLRIVIAEVHNTFDEIHSYVLNVDDATSHASYLKFKFPKQFYVSPFFEVSGSYELFCKEVDNGFDMHVNLCEQARTVFTSRMLGEARPFSSMQLLATAIRFPFNAFLTLAKIEWQAFLLYVWYRLPFKQKPLMMHAHSAERVPRRRFALLREWWLFALAKLQFNSEQFSFKSNDMRRS
ncbi:MAG: DUF1365 domain-containing protein [Bdellovibrionales bacterium]|nr:DUF1365 domain-containing protein [Bdellovibrionales bacterium]